MIHYHGTPCGGRREDVSRFLQGRHALIPWKRPEDIGTAAEVCRSFCLDNSAFSFWKRKIPVVWSEYYAWVDTWKLHPGFDFAIIPDVIDGSEQENDKLISEWPLGYYGVPVWHLHESLERLEWLAITWPRIALGSSGEWPTPGTKKWWARMAEAMPKICDSKGRPACKIHGLRMLNPKIFTKLPLASADSTNAVRNSSSFARFGMYSPPNASTRMHIIAERIESYNSAACFASKLSTIDGTGAR